VPVQPPRTDSRFSGMRTDRGSVSEGHCGRSLTFGLFHNRSLGPESQRWLKWTQKPGRMTRGHEFSRIDGLPIVSEPARLFETRKAPIGSGLGGVRFENRSYPNPGRLTYSFPTLVRYQTELQILPSARGHKFLAPQRVLPVFSLGAVGSRS
jgi:hypothetical protein